MIDCYHVMQGASVLFMQCVIVTRQCVVGSDRILWSLCKDARCYSKGRLSGVADCCHNDYLPTSDLHMFVEAVPVLY